MNMASSHVGGGGAGGVGDGGGGVGGGGVGGGGDGFGSDGGGGESTSNSLQHEPPTRPASGHVEPTVSAQQLTSQILFRENPGLHLHWLVGSFSTHVGGAGGGGVGGGGIGGGIGGGVGGGIGGDEGEGETQHTVAAPQASGTSGTQHLLTVAVSGANF